MVTTFLHPTLWGLGSGLLTNGFLVLNAVLCFFLVNLISRQEVKST
jgi:serine protease